MSSSSRVLLALGLVVFVGACFDGEQLRGVPCLSDEDCGPKLACIGPAGAAVCGGSDGGPVAGGRWPDSPTDFCSDGMQELASCPEPGEPGYGQDGNYHIAVPSYEESEGIVHDSVTGLDWEASSTLGEYTRSAALERCSNLQLGGRSWRLPSRLELVSLLDYGRALPFSGMESGLHWSSSDAGSATTGWMIDFSNWSTFTYPTSDTDMAFVICVSGEPLMSSFEASEATLRDGLTGLQWQLQHHEQVLPWTEALTYCEGLTLADASDWRLPSAKELLTLVRDDQQLVTGLDGAGEIFWSSSPDWPPDLIYVVNFPDGTTGSDQAQFPKRVRCVRGPD